MTDHYSQQTQGGSSSYSSSGVRNSELINQPTACRRCRKHKLRCSKETPACERCQNINAVCSYPPPPDRKLLAAQRLAQNPKPHARRESEASPQVRETPSNDAGKQPTLPDIASLPPEVALFLVDVFFSRHWNATFMFHKQRFTSDYLQNKVPDFVLLSIFAVASILTREGGVDLGISSSWVKYCKSHGQEWAAAAGQRVLLQAEAPVLDSVQASQNLAFYWYYVGDVDRAYFYTSSTYRACRLLRFHIYSENDVEVDPVLEEVKRRCFWSCWLASCISQGNATFKAESWKEALSLPLPSDEASFLGGKPELKEAFIECGTLVPINANGRLFQSPPPSIMGEWVKALSLWWEVQHFVKQDVGSSRNSLERVSKLLALDRRLEVFFENLHTDFRSFDGNSFTSPKTDACKLFTLHCIYHLCICVLHSSIVPIFCGDPSDALVSRKLVRMSAEEAVKHSMIAVDNATTFQAICTDKSRLSGVAGYALFVAVALQFKYLSAQGKLESHGTAHCNGAISIIRYLKDYIRPLEGLWTSLGGLFSTANIDINDLSTSKGRSMGSLHTYHPDSEQIISHQALSPDSTSNIDLYTYAVTVEAKAGPSSRDRSASTNSWGDAVGVQMTTRHSIHGPPHSNQNTHPAVVPQTHLSPGHPPLSQSYDSNADDQHSLGARELSGSQTSPQGTFETITTTAEGIAGFQKPMQEQKQAHVMSGVSMAMEIDGVDLWWDQGTERSEADPFGIMGSIYPWNGHAV